MLKYNDGYGNSNFKFYRIIVNFVLLRTRIYKILSLKTLIICIKPKKFMYYRINFRYYV